MPTHLAQLFTPEELAPATSVPPFSFTKGVPLLRVPVTERSPMYTNYGPGALVDRETVLFDLETDPDQLQPAHDCEVEARLARLMVELMAATDAPEEAYARLGLAPPPPARASARAGSASRVTGSTPARRCGRNIRPSRPNSRRLSRGQPRPSACHCAPNHTGARPSPRH